MGKMLKVLTIFLLTFTVIGCSNVGNKEQREVIEQYFKFLEEGNVEKLNELMVKEHGDDFDAISFIERIERISEYADMLGEVFKEEYEKFLVEVRENTIVDYKIEDIEIDDDEASVKVSGSYVMLENFDVYDILDSDEVNDILMDKINELGEDLDFEDYLKAVNDILDEMAEDIFKDMRNTLKELDSMEFTATFILIEEEDAWLIESVSSKQSLIYGDSTSNDESEEDIERFEVDKEKVRAENTLLGRGSLEDSSRNIKYVKTPFEFIDYNIRNGNNEEEEYSEIDFSSGQIILDLEVAGNVGETFILVVEEINNTILVERITLTEAQMVITRELNDINNDLTGIDIHLYLEEGFDERYNYGERFGLLYIYNTD